MWQMCLPLLAYVCHMSFVMLYICIYIYIYKYVCIVQTREKPWMWPRNRTAQCGIVPWLLPCEGAHINWKALNCWIHVQKQCRQSVPRIDLYSVRHFELLETCLKNQSTKCVAKIKLSTYNRNCMFQPKTERNRDPKHHRISIRSYGWLWPFVPWNHSVYQIIPWGA